MLSNYSEMTKPYIHLSMLRGIASIAIVLHHFTIYLLPQLNQSISQYTNFFPKSYLWVDFFFILSGFTFSLGYGKRFRKTINTKEYKSYIFSRFVRIYPLHFLTLIFLILVETIYAIYFNYYDTQLINLCNVNPPFTGDHSLWSIITNMLLIQAFQSWSYWNEPAWFLSALWVVYILFPFMILIYNHIKFHIHIILFPIALLPLVVMIWKYGHLDFVTYKSVVRALSEAYIGIFTFNLVNKGIVKHLFSKNHVFLFLLILVLFSIAIHINHLITILLFPLLILSAVSAPKLPNFKITFAHRFLYYLGTISFSTFMIHWPMLYTLKQMSLCITGIDFYKHFPNVLDQFTILLVSVTAVIAIAHFSFNFIEKKIKTKVSTVLK